MPAKKNTKATKTKAAAKTDTKARTEKAVTEAKPKSTESRANLSW